MPIDPNIILGIRPSQVQIADPIEQYSKGLALKSLINKGQLEDMQMSDERAVRDAYAQAGGDSARLRSILQGGGQYKAVQAIDKAALDRQKDEAEIRQKNAAAGKNELDAEISRGQHAASILAVAKKDPSQYPAVLSMLRMQYPSLAKSLPEQYDPRAIDIQIANGMTYVQSLEQQRADAAAEEVRRHNRATEGNTRRGQDMTDARARDLNEITRQGQQTQIVNDPTQGPLLIDKGTGATRRATFSDGTQVPGEATAKANQNAGDVQMLLAEAEKNIKEATGSYYGAALDQVARVFGAAPAGAVAIGNLKAIEGALLSKMPRMEGPQSNLDVQAYREAVGSIGDPTIPNKQKAAAVATVKRIQEKYTQNRAAGAPPPGQPGRDKLGGVLTRNPDGSFNYGFSQ